MLKRLKTAIPLILIVSIAFLPFSPLNWIFFCLLAIGILTLGSQEMFTMLNLENGKAYSTCTSVFSTLLVLNIAYHRNALPSASLAISIPLLCGFIFTSALLLFRQTITRKAIDDFLATLGIFFYVCLTMLCAVKLYFLGDKDGRELLAFMLIVTKMADIGAYILGGQTAKRPGGNHKLSKIISPKKSWEGLAGGILFSAGSAILLCKFAPALVDCNGLPLFTPVKGAIFGALAAIIGLIGDLTESAVKRAVNVKDSGKLPGIGGMMDILDSIIPIAPLFTGYVLYMLCTL